MHVSCVPAPGVGRQPSAAYTPAPSGHCSFRELPVRLDRTDSARQEMAIKVVPSVFTLVPIYMPLVIPKVVEGKLLSSIGVLGLGRCLARLLCLNTQLLQCGHFVGLRQPTFLG